MRSCRRPVKRIVTIVRRRVSADRRGEASGMSRESRIVSADSIMKRSSRVTEFSRRTFNVKNLLANKNGTAASLDLAKRAGRLYSTAPVARLRRRQCSSMCCHPSSVAPSLCVDSVALTKLRRVGAGIFRYRGCVRRRGCRSRHDAGRSGGCWRLNRRFRFHIGAVCLSDEQVRVGNRRYDVCLVER